MVMMKGRNAIDYIDEYKAQIWAQAMDLTDRYEDAEDLCQDTLLKVCKNWNQFESGTNFRAWVGKIMVRTQIKNYHQHVNRDLSLDKDESIAALMAKDNSQFYVSNPEKLFFDNYVDKSILEPIGTLADSFRIPFIYYIDGYSYAEISEMLDIPIGTVRSRLFRARRDLRSLIF